MKIKKTLPERESVLIVQPILAHYRNSLFARLVASSEFNVQIIAGKKIGNVKEIDEPSSKIHATLINKKIKAGAHSIIWQAGVIRYVIKQKPGIIVLTGVDPHLVSNLFLAFFNRLFFHAKIIWWGHAAINPKAKVGRVFKKFFFNLGNGIFTYSEAGKNNMELLVSPKISIEVIKNCINDEEYGFNHHAGISQKEEEFTILFSGRITKEKRLDILIDSLAILKNKDFRFRCFIIGDGPEKAAAEKLASEYQLDSMVTFLGEHYGNDCIVYFEQADLFILPGKVGLSIIHGLSYGLPVITSNMFEIHSPEVEIINPGYNGDFFSGFDPHSLSEKIIDWQDKISISKRQIQERCISSVREGGYTPEIMSKKMIDLFINISST